MRRLAIVALPFTLAACASLRGHGRSPDFEASSLESIYAPAGRFRGFVTVGDSMIDVRVDTALIASSPVDRLRVSLILATSDTTLGVALVPRIGDVAPPWRWLAESEPIEVANDSTHTGRRELHDLRFSIPRPVGAQPVHAWLIVHFAGSADVNGVGAQVRTFACSVIDLAGRTREARARERRMRTNYIGAC